MSVLRLINVLNAQSKVELISVLWLRPLTAVLESVSLDKFIPEAPASSEPGDLSPCRSPSTPRHLRYRQTGGTDTHGQLRYKRCVTLFACYFNASGSSQSHQGRTLAARCRQRPRSPSPPPPPDTAAPRVSTASCEGQKTQQRGGERRECVIMTSDVLSLFSFISQGLVTLRKPATKSSSSGELRPTES